MKNLTENQALLWLWKTRVYEKSELQECDLGLVATTEAVLYVFSNCVKYVENIGLRGIETQCAERMPYFPPHKMTLELGGAVFYCKLSIDQNRITSDPLPQIVLKVLSSHKTGVSKPVHSNRHDFVHIRRCFRTNCTKLVSAVRTKKGAFICCGALLNYLRSSALSSGKAQKLIPSVPPPLL